MFEDKGLFNSLAGSTGGLFGMALLARLLWHQRLVRLGKRRFWSWDLVWEIPTAVFCAIIGGGLAEYFELTGWPAYAVAGVVTWMGPRGIEVAVAKLGERIGTME